MRLAANVNAYTFLTKVKQQDSTLINNLIKDTLQANKSLSFHNENVKKKGFLPAENVFLPEEDTLELISEEEREELFFPGFVDSTQEIEDSQDGRTPLEDISRRLTRQLVASTTQFQVQLILGEAHNKLGELRMVAMSGDDDAIGEANALIRKLEKLIRRGNRKVTDIGKEENLKRAQEKAAKEEMLHRQKEIERELKRRYLERKNREKRYLEDRDDEDEESNGNAVNPMTKLDAAAEAQIAAQAKALAAAEVSAGQSQGLGDFSDGAGRMPGSASRDGSGEISGASSDGETQSSGIDISI